MVFLWDIYKWRKAGARLTLTAKANMTIPGNVPPGFRPDVGDPSRTQWIVVRAVNNGDRPTTLEKLALVHYKSRLHRLRRARGASFLVMRTGLDKELPFVVEPGKTWQGLVHQSDDMERLSLSGYLYCELHHSAPRSPAVTRVRIRQPKDAQPQE